jgi:hypothetical protein
MTKIAGVTKPLPNMRSSNTERFERFILSHDVAHFSELSFSTGSTYEVRGGCERCAAPLANVPLDRPVRAHGVQLATAPQCSEQPTALKNALTVCLF